MAGAIDYHNVRNVLAQNIHEEVMCANAGSVSKNVIWDPANNLSKSCTHDKKLVSEDYKLTYKLRDLITTTYVRSLDNPFTYKPIEPKLFAIKLLDTFNQGISLFIREYSKIRRLNPDDIKIIYKGGNVIATHSRIMYEKFGKYSKGLHDIIITKKMSELNRGDWDYTLYINSTDQRLISSARTFVLYMLSEIKKYLDTHNVFNMKNIADKLFAELYNRNDVNNILIDYRNTTNKSIEIEQLHVPGFTISGGKVIPSADPQIHSRYTFKRDTSIVDSF